MIDLQRIAKTPLSWLDGSQGIDGIPLCSRIRLARNVAGEAFQSELTTQEQRVLVRRLVDTANDLLPWSDGFTVDLEDLEHEGRQLLHECRYISREMTEGKHPAAVMTSPEGDASLMLNEEDHVRLQVLRPGLAVNEALQRAVAIDRLLEQGINWSTNDRYGYLTACPTNTGTGLRASVMLHLPGLAETNELPRALRSLSKLHMTARGLQGEGSDATGHYYQVSNQRTLGQTETEIVEQLQSIVGDLIRYEQMAREQLLTQKRAKLEDRVFRAHGILTQARRLSSKELTEQLSWLRLGRATGCIGQEQVDWPLLDALFIEALPAHLQLQHPDAAEAEQRDEIRAATVRQRLAESSN